MPLEQLVTELEKAGFTGRSKVTIATLRSDALTTLAAARDAGLYTYRWTDTPPSEQSKGRGPITAPFSPLAGRLTVSGGKDQRKRKETLVQLSENEGTHFALTGERFCFHSPAEGLGHVLAMVSLK